MKKKKIIFSGLLVLMLLLVSACSKITDESSSNEVSGDVASDTVGEGVENMGRPDISGIITKITANEITVAEIEMPEKSQSDNSEEDGEERQAIAFGTTQPVGAPGGGPGGGPGDGSGGGNRDSIIENMNLSEATKVNVIVPVGIAMTMMGDDGEVEATISDLESEQMVNIWLNDDVTDRNVADYVVIR